MNRFKTAVAAGAVTAGMATGAFADEAKNPDITLGDPFMIIDESRSPVNEETCTIATERLISGDFHTIQGWGACINVPELPSLSEVINGSSLENSLEKLKP